MGSAGVGSLTEFLCEVDQFDISFAAAKKTSAKRSAQTPLCGKGGIFSN
jgi:hypothetical protein